MNTPCVKLFFNGTPDAVELGVITTDTTYTSCVLDLVRIWRAATALDYTVHWATLWDEDGDSHTWSRYTDLLLRASELALQVDADQLEDTKRHHRALRDLHTAINHAPTVMGILHSIIPTQTWLQQFYEAAWDQLDPTYSIAVTDAIDALSAAA